MSKIDLVINFVIRSVIWGIVLGAVVGFLVQLALLGPVAFGLFGLTLGALAGTLLGTTNGVILAVFTLRFPNPLENRQQYKNTLSRASVGFTFLGSGIIFFVIVQLLTRSSIFSLFIALVASIFASLAAFYACQKVSGWYIDLLASQKYP